MKNRNIYGNISGYGPFDKLRKKRTGSIYDATTRYGGKIDLPAIAGVVEAGRRTQRKAGETNEDRIEEAAERLDARARAVAGNEGYGGPKFNAATFAKENNIDMNLRFDPKYAHPDPIVANPPPRVTPPKPKPKKSAAEILYPNDKGPRKAAPVRPAPPKPSNQPAGGRKLSPAEILYPNDKGPGDSNPTAPGVSGNDKQAAAPGKVSPAPAAKASSRASAGDSNASANSKPAGSFGDRTAGNSDSGEISPNSAPQPVGPMFAEASGSQGPRNGPGEALDGAIRAADVAAQNLSTGELSQGADAVTGLRGRVGREMRPLIDALVFEITQDQLAAAIEEAANAVAADIAAQGYSEADVAAAHAAALAEAKKGSLYADVYAAGQAATSGSASAGGGGTGVPSTSHHTAFPTRSMG